LAGKSLISGDVPAGRTGVSPRVVLLEYKCTVSDLLVDQA
jgi:hypothetical protein